MSCCDNNWGNTCRSVHHSQFIRSKCIDSDFYHWNRNWLRIGYVLELLTNFIKQIVIVIFFSFRLGFIYLPAIVSVTMYFEKYRSLATGIAVCGAGFGTFIFAPLTETLISNYSWRQAMLVIAGIVFTCIGFGSLFRPLKPVPKSDNSLNTEMRKSNSINISLFPYKKIFRSQFQ